MSQPVLLHLDVHFAPTAPNLKKTLTFLDTRPKCQFLSGSGRTVSSTRGAAVGGTGTALPNSASASASAFTRPRAVPRSRCPAGSGTIRWRGQRFSDGTVRPAQPEQTGWARTGANTRPTPPSARPIYPRARRPRFTRALHGPNSALNIPITPPTRRSATARAYDPSNAMFELCRLHQTSAHSLRRIQHP